MTDCVRFFVNGHYHEVVNPEPTTTILEYLRGRPGLTGTKEGCAEGDCGACTVVLAELSGDRYSLRSVNSCIQFLPTINGKELITVEGLSSDGGLHPVQQSMVECHGSQCGFCTPGFVMSLFALFHAKKKAGRAEVSHALAGNLCRCTGYRPIFAAAEAMFDLSVEQSADWKRQAGRGEHTCDLLASEEALINRLQSIQGEHPLALNNNGLFYAPQTVNQLAEWLEAHPKATVLAGGTDVGLWVTKQFRELPEIAYLGAVSGLGKVHETDEYFDIPAAVTLTEAFFVLQREYPGLKEVFRRFASPPICNAGTLVGNVANGSPIGDSMPVLMCLGASVYLRKGSATRRIPLDDFYLGYMKKELMAGEFVESVRVPKNRHQAEVASYKISKRFDQDISAVCAAFRLVLEEGLVKDIDVCFGGMAAVPARAKHTEDALRGKPWNQATVSYAQTCVKKDFSPISDMRAGQEYRTRVACNLLSHFLLQTQQSESTRDSAWREQLL